jgi:hypothetical protein
MGKTEQIGMGLAALCLGGLGLLLVATRPDVPDTPPRPAAPAVSLGDVQIATISKGEQIEIASYLVAGKRTVVEFTAQW